MRFTDDQWEVIVHAVAEMGDVFSEEDALKLGAWIKKAMIDEAIYKMILKGELYAKVNDQGGLICRKTDKFRKKMEEESADIAELEAKIEQERGYCNGKINGS